MASTTGIVWEEIPAAGTAAYTHTHVHTYITHSTHYLSMYMHSKGMEKGKAGEGPVG